MARRFEFFVAGRYLRSRRKEAFISIITVISVLSVALSVTVLNVVLSIMTGFKNELRDKLVSANSQIIVRHASGAVHSADEVVKKILAVPGVRSASPYSQHQVMLSTSLGSRGLIIRGVTDDAEVREKIGKQLRDPGDIDLLFSPMPVDIDRPDGTSDTVELPSLIIGRALQRTLSIAPGQVVTLMTPEFTASPQGLIPKMKRFVVVGTYSSGLQEYELGVAYTDIHSAAQYLDPEERASAIDVTVNNVTDAPEIARRIYLQLGGRSGGYQAVDWSESNRPFWEAIKLEERVYFIVLLLLILISSFCIVSTLVMVVIEKTKDIAVLKSLGASDRSIMLIFLSQGCLISVVGVVLGTVLGVLGCVGLKTFGFRLDASVFALETVPVHMIPSNFVLVAISAFFISSCAGIYPALRAARLKPAEVLRFE